jgi:hypothetical protein
MWHQAAVFIGTNIFYHISEDTNLDTTQGSTMKMKAAGSSSKSLVHVYRTTVQVCLSRTLFSSKSHSGKGDVIAEQEKTSVSQNLPNKLMKQNSSFSAWGIYACLCSTTYYLKKQPHASWQLNTNQENTSDINDLQIIPTTSTLVITGLPEEEINGIISS